MSGIASRIGWVTILVATLCLSIYGQTTSGTLTGTVFDPTGATVPGVMITATNDATGVVSSTTATSTGQYRINNLPGGKYTITATADGFTKAQIKNVDVNISTVSTANVTLQIGQASQTVEVSGASAVIDTSTAQVQTTFEAKQLQDLPVASQGSGVINLSLLNAGVATGGAIGVGTGPSVGGQRPRNNNFTIEGIDNNSKSVSGPLVQLPNDAVSEFTVLQNQFSPEFGHSSGGQFNQVIKSGTNEFHGMLYEYFQNRNLDAADNLNAVEGNPLHPRYDQNRFGGNFGGPIKRDKLFFFVDYEFNPLGETASTYYYAPTQAGYNTLATLPVNVVNVQQYQKYLGTAPGPTAGVGPILVNPTLNAGATSAAAFAAAPGTVPIEFGQISTSLPSFQNTSTGLVSVDYTISDKDQLRGRYVSERQGMIDTTGYPASFFTIVPTNNYLATISEYHNFSPNLTNELRLGFNRYSNNYGITNQQFPGLDQFPNIITYDTNASFGPDTNAPQYGIQNTYQINDGVSWTKGRHSFKFGFDGYEWISPQLFIQRSRGDYEYNFFSDYAFDYVPDFVAQRSLGGQEYSGNQYLLGGYANDTWKVTPNLTVDLGLRYEYQTVPIGEQLQSLNAVSSVPGLIDFRKPTAQADAFMPRIGLAYSPGTSGKTSFRAGFGINYDVLPDNFGLLSEPPQFTTTVDVTGNPGQGFLKGGGIPPTSTVTAPSLADLRAGTGGYIPDQRRPKSIQWNFGIQHVFAENYTFETRYLGSRGINLPVQAQINRQPVVTATNALPVYLTAPSQATLNALPNTLAGLTDAYNAGGNIVPAYAAAGFTGIITAYEPWGNSTYHGWANQLTRRFSNGLQFIGSYTWSHNIDDSTAEVFSTYTTPRRPQNSLDMRPERSSSALDHRQRLSFEAVYDLTAFKQRNWFLKNIVSNWEIAPIYTYQSGTYYTVQSGTDSNLNGDSGGDRVIVNPQGQSGIGSDASALTNSAGDTVAFLAVNPNAKYITAPKGTLANVGRNTEQLNPINNIDLTFAKTINITERYRLEFAARAFNVLNHQQYIGGLLNDVGPGANGAYTTSLMHLFTLPTSSIFADPTQAFSSNPRSMQLSMKFIF
jgi:hypothetical protein